MEDTIGKRISAHRKGLGLTQDALAEQLGVTAQAVSKWENDQSCPDISMLPRLAEIFHITTDELLGIQRTEAPPSEPEPQTQEASDPMDSINVPSTPPSFRQRLAAPGTGFALWLLLTGTMVMILRLKWIDFMLTDIALGSAITAFGIVGCFRRFSPLRLGCAVFGVLYLWSMAAADSLGIYTDWGLPLAIGVALLGLDLLIRALWGNKKTRFVDSCIPGHRNPSKNHCTYQGETFSCETNFGDGDRKIQLPRLSGGEGQVHFGQLHIDLTSCGEIADGCPIDLECSFGSLEILIPRQYRVEAASSSAFGNVEIKGAPDSGAQRSICLTCDANFGQITIRYI